MRYRTNYPALIGLCLFAIIALQLFLGPETSLGPKTGIYAQGSGLKKTLSTRLQDIVTKDPVKAFPLTLIALLYLAICAAGLGIALVWVVIRKDTRLPAQESEIAFPLDGEKTAGLLFRIIAAVFSAYILQLMVFYWWPAHKAGLKIYLLINGSLEIAMAGLIILALPRYFFAAILKTRQVLTSLAAYCAMLPAVMVFGLLNELLVEKLGLPSGANPAIGLTLMLKPGGTLFILLLQVALIGPVAEELLFRGVIFKALKNRLSFAWAAGLSSLLFACLHGSFNDLLPIFAVGMFLAWIYQKTQNITAPIAAHCLFNSLNILALLAVKSALNLG